DEGLLDGGLLRLETGDDAHEALVELTQAIGEVAFGVRRHKSARHVGEAHAVGFDDTPSRPAQARLYADDANRFRAHGARYDVGGRRIPLIAKCLPQWDGRAPPAQECAHRKVPRNFVRSGPLLPRSRPVSMGRSPGIRLALLNALQEALAFINRDKRG